ncbi:hypothetical protein H920_00108 [Fukomys damarensis]|uniref:Uncharacterized protein n=1 Tax=Fukomys damarensis TaxID=885580 RepID=A0A091E252_FUKDA|nr:hypothetical protein H920_00108 [Fukomys damarensis]
MTSPAAWSPFQGTMTLAALKANGQDMEEHLHYQPHILWWLGYGHHWHNCQSQLDGSALQQRVGNFSLAVLVDLNAGLAIKLSAPPDSKTILRSDSDTGSLVLKLQSTGTAQPAQDQRLPPCTHLLPTGLALRSPDSVTCFVLAVAPGHAQHRAALPVLFPILASLPSGSRGARQDCRELQGLQARARMRWEEKAGSVAQQGSCTLDSDLDLDLEHLWILRDLKSRCFSSG